MTDNSTSSDKSILVQPIQKSWKKTEGFKVKDVVKQFTVKARAPRARISYSGCKNEQLPPCLKIKSTVEPRKGEIKRAVDGLSFSAMTNEITVLLGHNGAGKSTTMSMLTGMVSPDSGSLFVGDLDVTKGIGTMISRLRICMDVLIPLKDTDKARKTIGFCPQHNILISELTVDEHFTFFAQACFQLIFHSD